MCVEVATPNLYAVSQRNCRQAPDTRMTDMGRRSGCSSSNDDVESPALLGLDSLSLERRIFLSHVRIPSSIQVFAVPKTPVLLFPIVCLCGSDKPSSQYHPTN